MKSPLARPGRKSSPKQSQVRKGSLIEALNQAAGAKDRPTARPALPPRR
jgi:hypothetical protein